MEERRWTAQCATIYPLDIPRNDPYESGEPSTDGCQTLPRMTGYKLEKSASARPNSSDWIKI